MEQQYEDDEDRGKTPVEGQRSQYSANAYN